MNTYKEQLSDTIMKKYATVADVTIEIPNDHKSIAITLGDPNMHNKTDDQRQKIANEIGQMVLRIYGKDYDFAEGQLLVSTDKVNTHPDPSTIVTTNINIDSLKKISGNR